jgi:glycosyltransferase involved in cell wall biosynthesis
MSQDVTMSSFTENFSDLTAVANHLQAPAGFSSGRRLRVGFLRRQIDIEDGITSHCETLINGLRKLGVDVVMMTGPILFTAKSEARCASFKELASGWVNLDMPRGRFAVRLRHVSELARQIRDNQIDVLHLHGLGTLLYTKAAAWAAGIPTVATVHLIGDDSATIGTRLLHSMRPLLRRVWPDRMIAICTEIERTFAQRWGVPPERVDLIPNGISTAKFRPPDERERQDARRQLGLTQDHFVVAHVGRLTAVKGHDVLFRAAAAMPDAADRLRILCLGTGDKAEELVAMARSLGLASKVQFLGYRDPLQVYWAADALALPSRSEGFPLVVLEAMGCGAIPLRTPAAGAFDQIDDGQCGYIFPFDDHAWLARLLSQLMANPQTSSRLRLAAIDTARKRFDVSVMASRTLDTYRAAISAASRRGSRRSTAAGPTAIVGCDINS